MGTNRRLYGERKFLVASVLQYEEEGACWHIEGRFKAGSIKSKFCRKYRIRIKPDMRWLAVRSVKFLADRIYETESVGRVTRRRMYGSGQWYISPFRPSDIEWTTRPGEFTFEEFEVTPGNAKQLREATAREKERLAARAEKLRSEALALGLPANATQQEVFAERLRRFSAEREETLAAEREEQRKQAALRLGLSETATHEEIAAAEARKRTEQFVAIETAAAQRREWLKRQPDVREVEFEWGWNPARQRHQWQSCQSDGRLFVLDLHNPYSRGEVALVRETRELVPGRVVLVHRVDLYPS